MFCNKYLSLMMIFKCRNIVLNDIKLSVLTVYIIIIIIIIIIITNCYTFSVYQN